MPGRFVGTFATAFVIVLGLGVVPSMSATKPNILFVIMDDVGIDQLSSFGYGGVAPPVTPTLDTVAAQGVMFRNTWSMPECSNGRAALLTGRYPFRNNVQQALFDSHLANSQVSPYDLTVPRMLKPAGYKSALFGKYHLGGPGNNNAGYSAPASMGWDYFYGWVGGVPASIDTTAGGVGSEDEGKYKCGYVPSLARAVADEGADWGACYVPKKSGGISCSMILTETLGDSPGLTCLNKGGVLVPNDVCQKSRPRNLKFNVQNAHYVSQLVINNGSSVQKIPVRDTRNRAYRATIEVDAAIKWINAQKRQTGPWMATVAFTDDHTPLQTPPGHLLSAATRERLKRTIGEPGRLGSDCSNFAVGRVISDAMIEAMDTEFRRLLVSTGFARTDGAGGLIYDPALTNTVIVIIGDNGSFGNTVQLPFDPNRAKATAYQTGVWVPLTVSGPLVANPGRDVAHMINATDVFGLFGEIAGVDPQQAAAPRTIDSKPMLSYLTNPSQTSIRQFNFTQGGNNILKNDARNPPCVIGSICSQTPPNKSVSEDNSGIYWGPGADDPSVVAPNGVAECWQVNKAIYDSAGVQLYPARKVDQLPQNYYAGRDSQFKLVRNFWQDYSPDDNLDGPTDYESEEFYKINESKNPALLLLDREGLEIFKSVNGSVTRDIMNNNEAASYAAISQYLNQELASQPACPGDGNGDGLVDSRDLRQYNALVRTWSGSSVFDFNHDAITNGSDRSTILANMGSECRPNNP